MGKRKHLISIGGTMSENIEIEYKVLLTENQFNKLEVEIPFPQSAVVQVNHYFDTHQFLLRSKRNSLRIREVNETYILTFKQPINQHILETDDILTENEYHAWKNGNPIPKQNITEKLTKLGISINELTYIGSLKTERKQFSSGQIIYCLDKSTYNGLIDYELEIEVPNVEIGETIFHTLLERFNIPKTEPISKIERFFKTMP